MVYSFVLFNRSERETKKFGPMLCTSELSTCEEQLPKNPKLKLFWNLVEIFHRERERFERERERERERFSRISKIFNKNSHKTCPLLSRNTKSVLLHSDRDRDRKT